MKFIMKYFSLRTRMRIHFYKRTLKSKIFFGEKKNPLIMGFGAFNDLDGGSGYVYAPYIPMMFTTITNHITNISKLLSAIDLFEKDENYADKIWKKLDVDEVWKKPNE